MIGSNTFRKWDPWLVEDSASKEFLDGCWFQADVYVAFTTCQALCWMLDAPR